MRHTEFEAKAVEHNSSAEYCYGTNVMNSDQFCVDFVTHPTQ